MSSSMPRMPCNIAMIRRQRATPPFRRSPASTGWLPIRAPSSPSPRDRPFAWRRRPRCAASARPSPTPTARPGRRSGHGQTARRSPMMPPRGVSIRCSSPSRASSRTTGKAPPRPTLGRRVRGEIRRGRPWRAVTFCTAWCVRCSSATATDSSSWCFRTRRRPAVQTACRQPAPESGRSTRPPGASWSPATVWGAHRRAHSLELSPHPTPGST